MVAPMLIVIGCVYMEILSGSCTGQSEVWMQSVVPQYDPSCTCWFANFIWRCEEPFTLLGRR